MINWSILGKAFWDTVKYPFFGLCTFVGSLLFIEIASYLFGKTNAPLIAVMTILGALFAVFTRIRYKEIMHRDETSSLPRE